jgi:hypothetical protein
MWEWERVRDELLARDWCTPEASEADVRRLAGMVLAAHGQPAAVDDRAVLDFIVTLPTATGERVDWQQIRQALVARGLCTPAATEANVRRVAGMCLAVHNRQAADDPAILDFIRRMGAAPPADFAIVPTVPPPATANPTWQEIRAALALRGLCSPEAGEPTVRRMARACLDAHDLHGDHAAILQFVSSLPTVWD